jgi:hypothetical protein
MAKVRRPSARRDGLGSVNSALDCFQKEEIRTAGGVRCAGELRPWMGCSNPCDKIKEEGSGMCASAREREGDRNWVAGDLVIVRIGESRRRQLRAPVRNVDGLAMSQVTGGEGKGRGDRGLLMGTAGTRIVQVLLRNEEGE